MEKYGLTALAGLSITVDFEYDLIDQQITQHYFNQLIQRHAPHLFNQKIELDIRISEGSVKASITILGVVYLAISQYGSFRSGVDYLINDAKLLKDITVNMLIKDGMDETEIREIKRLHCVPDKIRLVLLKIERLEQSLLSSSIEVQQKQITSIKTSVINILNLLGDEIDQALFLESLDEKYIPDLPLSIPNKEQRVALLNRLTREEDLFPKKNVYTNWLREHPDIN